MATDAGVRKLVELIFCIFRKKSTISEEMAAHSSIPSSFLNEDFSERLTSVLLSRHYFVMGRWLDYFDDNFRSMLSTHMNYASHILHACLYENQCSENIFDSFISVCVLISYLSEDTLSKVGVDFRDMNPDIFMVFYRKALRSSFRIRKNFNRLLEYIRDHKYIKWLNDFTVSRSKERHSENRMREIASYQASENISEDMVYELKVKGASLARDVLSSTSVKLPDLPNEYELIERLVAYRKRQIANEDENKRKDEAFLTVETSHGEASLNFDSKTDFEENEENIAWHESIIEAVIRHNHSKDSGQEIANDQRHEEANGILEHLESKIKFLIEVLDECSEE